MMTLRIISASGSDLLDRRIRQGQPAVLYRSGVAFNHLLPSNLFTIRDDKDLADRSVSLSSPPDRRNKVIYIKRVTDSGSAVDERHPIPAKAANQVRGPKCFEGAIYKAGTKDCHRQSSFPIIG